MNSRIIELKRNIQPTRESSRKDAETRHRFSHKCVWARGRGWLQGCVFARPTSLWLHHCTYQNPVPFKGGGGLARRLSSKGETLQQTMAGAGRREVRPRRNPLSRDPSPPRGQQGSPRLVTQGRLHVILFQTTFPGCSPAARQRLSAGIPPGKTEAPREGAEQGSFSTSVLRLCWPQAKPLSQNYSEKKRAREFLKNLTLIRALVGARCFLASRQTAMAETSNCPS